MKNKYSLIVTFVMLFVVQGLFAQLHTLSGKVTEQGSGNPLPFVSVYVEGTTTGVITDLNGAYSFKAKALQGKTLVFSLIGFKTASVDLSDGSQVVNIELVEDLLKLDEVIVTGTSVGVNKRILGNAISTVSSDELVNNAATAIDQSLSGKLTGALVQQNSGDPAGGISIRLRGPSTVQGSSDPLYIVDGIIISNASNELIDIGGYTQNRLSDLNPNDIERIEVIKGAAAAAIYGSRASNGVIQIFTKKGKAGAPKFSYSLNLKSNSLRKKIDYNKVPLAWEKPSDNSDRTTVPATRFDYQEDIFDTGFGIENYLSVSGGSNKTNYFISASQLSNEGIIKNTDYNRTGFKININQKAFDWLQINAGLNYVHSETSDIPNGGINAFYGAITGLIFADNANNPAPDESGVYPRVSLFSTPLEVVNRFDFGQKVNRIISSVGLEAKITDNLSAKYTLGVDYFNQSGKAYIPNNNTTLSNQNGFSRRADINNLQYNSDLNFSYIFDINEDLTSTTILGGAWQYEEFERVNIEAKGLPPTVETATTGSLVSQGEARSQISYWGGFLQQSFSFKDKLYLNGALRMDGASTFGEDERNQLYAKASVSYIVSAEDFWEDTFGDNFNTFKVRASWGQSGNLTALSAYQRYTIYNPSSIGGSTSLIPSTQQGDLNIAPERQEEFEVGFDAGFINNRLGVEFTYYKQNVTDLLLSRELAPSTGYSSRIQNVGNLENKGIELLLRGIPIKNEDLSWDITATYSKNENVVTKVAGGGQFALANSFASSYVIEGESLGVFYRQFYARNADGSITLDANGYPSRGTTDDGKTSKVLGDPNPKWFGSLLNELRYKSFGLKVQLDAVQGFDIFNWNRRILNRFGGGAQVGEELRGNLAKGYGRSQYGIFEEFVEDGSFVKLRELALSYNLKSPFESVDAIKLSLIGRNLISWDNYSGWDPEINTTGQNNGVRGFDIGGVPIPRTYQLSINVSF